MDYADPALLEELLGAVREVAEHGAFTLGHHVESFEREFAAYCEADFAVGVSSGTEALALALRALEIGPGDEVIVPTNSFIATAEAVSAVGAMPRLVDVDPDSHLLTAEIVARALAARALRHPGAPVRRHRRPRPDPGTGPRSGAHVVEDACQAHGARYRGRRVGTPGRARLLQLLPRQEPRRVGRRWRGRDLRPELADRVRLLRAHGERPRYHHSVIGSTARLDALQAAVLRRKLTRSTAGTTSAGGWAGAARVSSRKRRRRRTAVGARPRRLPFAEADHVFTCSWCAVPSATCCASTSPRGGVASAVHYPVPIHVPWPTPPLAWRRAACP